MSNIERARRLEFAINLDRSTPYMGRNATRRSGHIATGGLMGTRWETMLRQQHERLVRHANSLILRLGRTGLNAEDIVQQALLKYQEDHQEDLDCDRIPPHCMAKLLDAVAREHNRLRRRMETRQPHSSDDLEHLVQPGDSPEAREWRRCVHRALHSLDPIERQVLVLLRVEECSRAEVAEIMKIPPGTVASLERRARDNFRRLLPIQQKEANYG
jgi:RNA polymerase sigma-70 factor, ECF subfamily